MRKEVIVEGMTCNGCAGTVQRKFSELEGVNNVSVDLASKTVSIESNADISKESLQQALEETAYKVV